MMQWLGYTPGGCVIIVAALRIHLLAGPLKAVAPGAALGVCPMLRPRFYLRHAAALEKHYLLLLLLS